MPRDRFWLEPFHADYRFVRVDLSTGLEGAELANVTGGSVERNQDTAIFEQGSIDYVGALDLGTDLLRVYLEASSLWTVESRTEALGTFYVSTPKASSSGAVTTGSADIYGRLRALAQDDFDGPYVIPAGTNMVAAAKKIAEDCGLEVVADESDAVLTSTWVFGISTTSSDEDRADSKLSAINRLLDAAGFLAAHTDPFGRVLFRRYVEPDQRPISFDYVEGPDCRVTLEIDRERDTFGVANVIHVDFSSQDISVRGTAVDDDPDSPYSTVSTGRRETARYDLSDLPTSATEDSNILAGAAVMQVGVGTKESGTYRQSDSHGSISTVYVPDSPQTAVFFGLKVASDGGRIGFCQDKVGSLAKGKPVTQSLWIKGTKGARVSLQAWWVPSLSAGSPMHYETLTGKWQRLIATETPADGYSDVSAGYVYLESAGEAVVVADKVEEGAGATPWPHDAIQAAADAKATELLRDGRSVIQRVNCTCAYDPVSVYDAGNIRLPSAGIDAERACIRTQKIKFEAACPMDIEARKFERSAA
jgi:hypothetical protein